MGRVGSSGRVHCTVDLPESEGRAGPVGHYVIVVRLGKLVRRSEVELSGQRPGQTQ